MDCQPQRVVKLIKRACHGVTADAPAPLGVRLLFLHYAQILARPAPLSALRCPGAHASRRIPFPLACGPQRRVCPLQRTQADDARERLKVVSCDGVRRTGVKARCLSPALARLTSHSARSRNHTATPTYSFAVPPRLCPPVCAPLWFCQSQVADLTTLLTESLIVRIFKSNPSHSKSMIQCALADPFRFAPRSARLGRAPAAVAFAQSCCC